MKTAVKIAGLIVLTGGAYGLSQLLKTKNTGEKISLSIVNIEPPKFNGGALQVSVKVAIDNPTDHTLKLKMPYVTAIYNGQPVGNSKPSDAVKSIKANARTIVTGINIQIPFANMGILAVMLLVGKMPKIILDINVSTEADGIPYTAHKHFEP